MKTIGHDVVCLFLYKDQAEFWQYEKHISILPQ